jgi:hypothetical protein
VHPEVGVEDLEVPVVAQVDVQRKIKLHIDKAVAGYPETVSQLFLLMVPLKNEEVVSRRTPLRQWLSISIAV